MWHMRSHRSREVLILSGDQLYQMDFRKMHETHRRHVADATVAVLPVSREQTSAFGILKVNRQGRIVHFEEKPGPERLDDLESDIPGVGRGFLASMGIYMFSRETLEQAMDAILSVAGYTWVRNQDIVFISSLAPAYRAALASWISLMSLRVTTTARPWPVTAGVART